MPPVAGARQYIFGALAITRMALLFDWVAIVPGPRDFHAGASAIHRGGSVNSTFGRVAFGLFAVFLRSLRLLCLAENTTAAQAAYGYRPHVRSRPPRSASDRFQRHILARRMSRSGPLSAGRDRLLPIRPATKTPKHVAGGSPPGLAPRDELIFVALTRFES
jgi:hypothetical protein